jgi:phosphotransferase system HPr (HPr) family protein
MSYSKTVSVINPSGLHARPATQFVWTASKFKSNIIIEKEGKQMKANAKSIMFVLALGVHKDDVITVSATGDDEKEAVESLIQLVVSGFNEA